MIDPFGETPTYRDAIARRIVVLASGEEGRLVFVNPSRTQAKVLVAGRYRQVPPDSLRLVHSASIEVSGSST